MLTCITELNNIPFSSSLNSNFCLIFTNGKISILKKEAKYSNIKYDRNEDNGNNNEDDNCGDNGDGDGNYKGDDNSLK